MKMNIIILKKSKKKMKIKTNLFKISKIKHKIRKQSKNIMIKDKINKWMKIMIVIILKIWNKIKIYNKIMIKIKIKNKSKLKI